MKKVLTRSLLTWFLAIAFFAGLGYFVVRLVTNADEWAQLPMNAHLSSNGLAKAGTIYDRNGVVLAESVEGERVYNNDESIRKAVLHSVGDDTGAIATSIQSIYRNDLVGYSFLLGLGLPESFRSTKDITLTIDAQACATVYEAMAANEYKGAAVVYNYETGEIICKVSTPTYDPYSPPEITEGDDTWDGVYLDKVISAAFPPGSTFKIITSAAALEMIKDSQSRYLYCEGSSIIGGEYVTCVEPHNEIDMTMALATSCNVYFAELAAELGSSTMQSYADRFGFNQSFSMGKIDIKKSLYDVSKADQAGLAWSGVGQYTDMANPLHMAMIASAIANGGSPVMPYEIKEVSSVLNLGCLTAGKPGQSGQEMMRSSTANKLSEMMRATVRDHYGDSTFGEFHAAAKTGTAEVGDGTEDGWVVGFVTDEGCPLAFAVCIENGGFGISSAVPIAKIAVEACAPAVRGY